MGGEAVAGEERGRGVLCMNLWIGEEGWRTN
mgnify:CR=1 FL=1